MNALLDVVQAQKSGRSIVAVDISEMVVANDPAQILVTYSLGSCVGVTVFDLEARVGGLIHCMLPLSRIDPRRATARPAMFVDTGLPTLLQAVYDLGAARHRLLVKAAGGGSPLGPDEIFKIGQRNLEVLGKVLWKNGLDLRAQSVGGAHARTLALDLQSGRTIVRTDGKESEL
ncbi:MAG: chemotaxis protein CheD [Candidatus Latescibacteria bacterium]|nr:chemotaxis protein CheD [Candidatus Latescibacterota bacterium]